MTATYVSGGASGIGRAVVLGAAAEGHAVAVLDRDRDGAAAVVGEALTAGAEAAVAVACDVADEASVEAAFAAASAAVGPPTGVVAAAGIDRAGLVHDLTARHWREIMAVNLDGVFHVSKHALRAFLGNGIGGSLVCVSSPTGFAAIKGGMSAYSASKGGVSALVKTMAIDYAEHGIRVNALVPGSTDTPMMWANVRPEDLERMKATVDAEIPVGRIARPDEVAAGALWLLSERASYVTGSHLCVDGGILAKLGVSV